MDNLVLTGINGSIEECIDMFIDHITKHANVKVKETIVTDSTTQVEGVYLKNYQYILSVNDMKNRFFSVYFNNVNVSTYGCSFKIVEYNGSYIEKKTLPLNNILTKINENWTFGELVLKICSKNNKLLYIGSSKIPSNQGYCFEYDEDNDSYAIITITDGFKIFTDFINSAELTNASVSGQSWFNLENHCLLENIMYIYSGVLFKSKLFYQVTLPNNTSVSMTDCIVDGKKYLRVNGVLIDCY